LIVVATKPSKMAQSQMFFQNIHNKQYRDKCGFYFCYIGYFSPKTIKISSINFKMRIDYINDYPMTSSIIPVHLVRLKKLDEILVSLTNIDLWNCIHVHSTTLVEKFLL